MNWLILAITTLVMWGIWGFLAKIASAYLDWKEYMIISGIGTMLVIFLVYSAFRPHIKFQPGFLFALLAGIAGTLPVIFFFQSLTLGKASVVVPLTALYPAVTALLAFFILGEKITALQGLGIGLAILAILLLSLK